MTSNEGFPEGNSILVRKLNEYEGQHRFGGGSDYDGDPNFLDILVPPGKGGKDEVDLQHKIMSAWVSGDDPAQYVYVKLPMVYLHKAMEAAALRRSHGAGSAGRSLRPARQPSPGPTSSASR